MTIKASRLVKFRVLVLTLYRTLGISTVTLINSLVRRSNRNMDTLRFNKWSERILSYANVTYENNLDSSFDLSEGRVHMIMSNHASLFDIPLVVRNFPGDVRMMAKKELFDVPIWGRAMKKSDFVSVDRQNRVKANEDLKFAKKKMESGIVLWVSPEGTRSKDGSLLPFKSGVFNLAMQTNAIILPVSIIGANKILPAKSTDLNLGQHVKIFFHKPIDTTGYGSEEKIKLKDKVYNVINSVL